MADDRLDLADQNIYIYSEWSELLKCLKLLEEIAANKLGDADGRQLARRSNASHNDRESRSVGLVITAPQVVDQVNDNRLKHFIYMYQQWLK